MPRCERVNGALRKSVRNDRKAPTRPRGAERCGVWGCVRVTLLSLAMDIVSLYEPQFGGACAGFGTKPKAGELSAAFIASSGLMSVFSHRGPPTMKATTPTVIKNPASPSMGDGVPSTVASGDVSAIIGGSGGGGGGVNEEAAFFARMASRATRPRSSADFFAAV